MKRICVKIFTILMAAALVFQYSFAAVPSFVYAGTEDNAPVVTEEMNNAVEAEEPAAPEVPDAVTEEPAPDEVTEEPAPEQATEPVPADETDAQPVVDTEPAADEPDDAVMAEPSDDESIIAAPAASGSGTQSDPYVLEYGESITLTSSQGSILSNWSIDSGSGVRLTGATVTNTNTGTRDTNVVIDHAYANNILQVLFPGHEYYYIKANRIQRQVTYKVQDGGASSYSDYETATVGNGTAVTLPTPDAQEGYEFYGWYADESCTTKVADAGASYTVTSDLTLYGKFTTSATITYKKNLSGETVTLPPDVTDGVGINVTIGTASSGKKFDSWNTAADGSGDTYDAGQQIAMPEGGLVLYAQWTEEDDTLTIHYYRNFGNDWIDIHVPGHGTDVAEKNAQATLWDGEPVRYLDYIFTGWSTDKYATTPTYYPGQTINTEDSDISLYAVWATLSDLNVTLHGKSDEVTYDGQEHTISGIIEGEPNADGYIEVGRLAFFPVYVKASDFEASGTDAGSYPMPVTAMLYAERFWPLSGYRTLDEVVRVEEGTLVIKPAVVTVETDTDKKAYDGTELTIGGKVTLPDGSESTFTAEGGAVTLLNGETLNMRAIGTQTDPGTSENGYEVDWGKPDDWGDSASTAKKYNYTITPPEENGTLTVFFNMAYDPNTEDAVESMPDPNPVEVSEVNEDGDVTGTISDSTPAREGFVFKGWAKDAGAAEADYQPGENISITTEDVTDGTLTLYAVWAAEYTITYELNGGELDGETGTVTQTFEDGTVITLPAPTREGYEFDYWEGSRYNAGDEYTVTEDHTFTAQWKAVEENTDDGSKDTEPGTGDDTNPMLWILVMAGAAAVLAATGRKRREN